MKTRAPCVYDPITERPPCDLRASVQLTHDHDVNVGQQTAVAIGGVTLVDSCVLRSSVMEHYGVVQHPPVVLWVIWPHTHITSSSEERRQGTTTLGLSRPSVLTNNKCCRRECAGLQTDRPHGGAMSPTALLNDTLVTALTLITHKQLSSILLFQRQV